MPVKSDREYRTAHAFETRRAENEEESYIVEGYASTFEPYELYREGNHIIYECIDAHAFDEADMSDVIMQYDHEGRVYARISNDTLQVSTDEHGLKIRADLSSTEGSRQLYEEIKSGLITQMSFAFTVEEDSFDKNTYTRNISRVRKVYDVSAVSIPANPGTEISARTYCEGVLAEVEQERLAAEKRDRDIAILRLKFDFISLDLEKGE